MDPIVTSSGKSILIRQDLKSKLKLMHKMSGYYLLLLPLIAYFLIFRYVPMYGIVLAFKDFKIGEGILGSPWAGLEYFTKLFTTVSFPEVLRNTVLISVYRIIYGFPIPLLLALLLNEVYHIRFKKVVQTISYMPYFMSWVVLAGIIMEFLSPSRGVVNYLIEIFGGKPIYFLTEPAYFRSILVATGVWQSAGWNSILYLAAISSIDTEQYEAANIDGASRWQLMRFITLPSIASVICILLILSLGGILNAGGMSGGALTSGFDQIFNLYNPQVYRVGDIIDTYVYREGLVQFNYSLATAAGLFKNVIGFFFVIGGNLIVRRIGEGEGAIW